MERRLSSRVHIVFAKDPSLNASIHIRLFRTTWNSGSGGIWHLWHLKAPAFVCIHAHPSSTPPNTEKHFSKLLNSSPSNNWYRCPLCWTCSHWVFDSQFFKPLFPVRGTCGRILTHVCIITKAESSHKRMCSIIIFLLHSKIYAKLLTCSLTSN